MLATSMLVTRILSNRSHGGVDKEKDKYINYWPQREDPNKDLIKIGSKPTFRESGSQDLVARIWKPRSGSQDLFARICSPGSVRQAAVAKIWQPRYGSQDPFARINSYDLLAGMC